MRPRRAKTDIGWGHQIRSYVLQPYQLVKDLRTGVESTSPSEVLDGDLDHFMEASLAQRIEGVRRRGRRHGLEHDPEKWYRFSEKIMLEQRDRAA